VSPKETSAEGAAQMDEIFSINLHPGQLDTIWREIFFPYFCTVSGAYMGSIAGSRNAGLIEINSQPDHVHRYVSLPFTIAVADLVNEFEANSSRWIRQTFPNCRCFRCQAGRYTAFSVSVPRLRRSSFRLPFIPA
jgi:REP element-mobilizing transposase RayT